MQKRRPNTSQTKYFAWKGCIFWVLQHLRKSVQNELKRHSEMTPKILQNAGGSLPKAMPKISTKNVTQKMQMKSIWGQKWPKIAPKTRLINFTFWRLFWYLLPRWRQEASGRPLGPKNHQKFVKKKMSPSLCCMRFWICFSICGLAHGDVHTIRADCRGRLFGGAAMTRRRRLR